MSLFANIVMLMVTLSYTAPVYAQDSGCILDSCLLPPPDTTVVAVSSTPTLDLEDYERYRLPDGVRCEVGGETFQCFNLDEYTQLLEMDVDLRFYVDAHANAQLQIVQLVLVAAQLRLALDLTTEQTIVLSEERDRLLALWTEENKLRLEAENRPMLGSFVAWGLVAAEAVAIFILSLVVLGNS